MSHAQGRDCFASCVSLAGTQNMPWATYAQVVWDTVSAVNTDAIWASGPNQSRFTIQKTGYYLVTACVEWLDTNGFNSRAQIFKVNGAFSLQYASTNGANPGGAPDLMPKVVHSEVLHLNAGDYVELAVNHDMSGSTVLPVTGCFSSIVLLGV